MVGRREKPIDPRAPYATFAYGLRALRAAQGKSLRQISREAYFSIAVLSGAMSGWKLPTQAVTLAIVRVCGGCEDEWTDRWKAEEQRGRRH